MVTVTKFDKTVNAIGILNIIAICGLVVLSNHEVAPVWQYLVAMYIGFCAVSYGSLMARRWKRLTENKRWLLPLGLAANIIYLLYYL